MDRSQTPPSSPFNFYGAQDPSMNVPCEYLGCFEGLVVFRNCVTCVTSWGLSIDGFGFCTSICGAAAGGTASVGSPVSFWGVGSTVAGSTTLVLFGGTNCSRVCWSESSSITFSGWFGMISRNCACEWLPTMVQAAKVEATTKVRRFQFQKTRMTESFRASTVWAVFIAALWFREPYHSFSLNRSGITVNSDKSEKLSQYVTLSTPAYRQHAGVNDAFQL